MTLIQEFKDTFWDAFSEPKLKTEKFRNKFRELETLNRFIAGPLFSIYEKGECNYVFSTGDHFQGICNADDLLDWFRLFITEYKNKIESTNAETEEEVNDLKILLYQTDIKMHLADLAYQIHSEMERTRET